MISNETSNDILVCLYEEVREVRKESKGGGGTEGGGGGEGREGGRHPHFFFLNLFIEVILSEVLSTHS